ncbi:MAG: thioredoxin family protein [Candidatus Zixiibacteriota bacterium]
MDTKNKTYRRGCTALALLTLLAVVVIPPTAFTQTGSDKSKDRTDSGEKPAEISWMPYEDGLRLAQEQDRQVLIDFSTAWCGYCKKMDRETFTDRRVIDYINENFIPVKVDGDSRREFEIDGFKTSEKRITKEIYGVRGFPTFWFLESDGAKIGQQPGYQPADGFLSLLEYVSDRKYDEKK